MKYFRPPLILVGLLAAWQAIVWMTGVQHYILPGPGRVVRALVNNWPMLFANARVTATEIILGLMLGAALGIASALLIASFRPMRSWLLPVMVVSQAIPVFAIAPVLVLWLGYGLASKVAMATLIIYFPVTAAFFDGLRRTEPGWLDLATTMSGTPLRIMWHVRVPAALPALGSGIRVATAVAPIGAIVGEWVGSSAGLGYAMLHANARMQVDIMFAALFLLGFMAVGLYVLVDAGLRHMMPWRPETRDTRV